MALSESCLRKRDQLILVGEALLVQGFMLAMENGEPNYFSSAPG